MDNHTELIEKLEHSHGNVPCIATAEIRRLMAENEAAQAEIDMHMRVAVAAIDNVVQVKAERDAALARLATLGAVSAVTEEELFDAAVSWCESNGINSLEPDQLSSLVNSLCITMKDAATGASPVQPSQSAEHWHSLYLKKCQELHDEKARLGAEIETLELAAIDDAERYAVQPSQADAQDAARYRWLREYLPSDDLQYDDDLVLAKTGAEIDAAIDAAINAKESK